MEVKFQMISEFFSTDLTDEAIASMQNGEFDRCVVAITGNAFVCGDVIYDLSMRYAAGEKTGS